jgi:hypothetical protein
MSDPRYDPKLVAEIHRKFWHKMRDGGEIDCVLAGNPIPRGAPARPTPQCTIEAALYSVRERGLTALHEPATLERLQRCDEAACQQIDRRIADFIEAGRIEGEHA